MFRTAAARHGLSVSLKTTNAMAPLYSTSVHMPLVINANGATLRVADKFCYLASIISADATIDDDLNTGLANANLAFDLLCRRLWKNHEIRLDVKVDVYRAAIL